MTATTILSIFAGIVALAAAYFYFIGIDPETKRALEKKALRTMGENKMSYLAKDQIDKIPTSDQENLKQVKKGLGNFTGGAVNNPLGEQAGEGLDKFTSPLTGR